MLVGWLGVGTSNASAAWNNVFQVCCHNCRSQQSSSFFAPSPGCCPTVRYVQRCFYQPVTSYKMETRVEAVTSYRTSYYMEPCTSYRYVSYYDPCTCQCKQACQAVTSYRVRSQCNPVVSYVQRCAMVPVTTMRQSFYMEPVIEQNCPPACPTACPTACPAPCQDGSGASNGLPPQTSAPPELSETPGRADPALSEGNGLIPPPNLPGGGASRQRLAPPPPAPAPTGRMDRTASLRVAPPKLQGQVVHDDRFTPRAAARVVFVNASQSTARETANTDALGRFAVNLPQGDYWMYVAGGADKPTYHSTIRMAAGNDRTVTVVSR